MPQLPRKTLNSPFQWEKERKHERMPDSSIWGDHSESYTGLKDLEEGCPDGFARYL